MRGPMGRRGFRNTLRNRARRCAAHEEEDIRTATPRTRVPAESSHERPQEDQKFLKSHSFFRPSATPFWPIINGRIYFTSLLKRNTYTPPQTRKAAVGGVNTNGAKTAQGVEIKFKKKHLVPLRLTSTMVEREALSRWNLWLASPALGVCATLGVRTTSLQYLSNFRVCTP